MEKQTNPNTITLTGILLKDKEHGSYIAFLKEFPEAATEVFDEKEAPEKLFSALMDVLDVKREIAEEEKLINGDVDDEDVITLPFNLSLQP